MMLRELARDLGRQPIRTLTSLAGIAWGTLSILLLLAFSVGFEELFQRRSRGLGKGIAIAWPSRTTKPWQGLPPGRRIRATQADIAAIGSAVPSIEAISAEHERFERLLVGEKALRIEVSGVEASFGRLRELSPQSGGRFLNDADLRERRRVIFLGDRVARSLFGDREPVGASMMLHERSFVVVGVLEPKEQDSDYGSRDKDRAFVPASTYRDVWGSRYVTNFVYRSRDPKRQDACTTQVIAALAARLQFDPTDRGALSLWDTTEQQRMLGAIFLAFHLVLGIAGVFTLLAGAVGIANLMFLLVRRRREEIGLKLAVGARPVQVRREVLGQTLFLILVGGGSGAALAIGIVTFAGTGPWTSEIGVPRIPPALGASGVVLLLAIGFLAGWFPARAAERLDPIDALARAGDR